MEKLLLVYYFGLNPVTLQSHSTKIGYLFMSNLPFMDLLINSNVNKSWMIVLSPTALVTLTGISL